MNKNLIFHKDNSIHLAKENYVQKRSNMQIHCHDYLTVSLILEGSLIEHTPTSTKIVKCGNILIKPPGLMHENIFTEDCAILSFKIFDSDYYQFKWNEWSVLEQPTLLKYFLNVLHQKDRKHTLSELKNALQFSSKIDKTAKIPEKIKHVKTLIDFHFLEFIQISDLAKEVNLNPVYLGQAFIKYYQTDIKTYQQQLRLHFAVSQMCYQKENLTKIAYNAGYADQSHFSKTFKKSTKISPKRFTSFLNL